MWSSSFARIPTAWQQLHDNQPIHSLRLFRKLYVFGKEHRVPLDVLGSLWSALVNNDGLLLVNQLLDLKLVTCAQSQKASNNTYGLYDLVNEYCESSARGPSARGYGVHEPYHSEFFESFKPKLVHLPKYDGIEVSSSDSGGGSTNDESDLDEDDGGYFKVDEESHAR